MTDREPDDLYDALRDRLTDYGQEPPAPLWAGIRAQLPPPVAAPQRRRRRQAAWLGMLLVLLSAGTLGWWRLAERSPMQPGRGLARQATPPANQAAPLDATAGSGASSGRVASPRPAASGTSAAIGAAATGATGAVGSSLAANELAASGTGVARAWRGNSPVVSAGTSPQLARATASRRRAVAAPLPAADRAGSSQAAYLATTRSAGGPNPRAGRLAIASLPAPAAAVAALALPLRTAASARGIRPGAGAEAKRAVGAVAAKVISQAVAAPSGAVARPGATADNGLMQSPRLASIGVASSRAAGAAGRQAARTAAPALASATGVPQPAETRAGTAGELADFANSTQTTWQPIGTRATALALSPGAIPGVLAGADTLPRRPPAPVRRWAVQAVAGPALTSRSLASTSLSDAAAPTNNSSFPTSSPTRTVQHTGSPDKEQAAPGFGAEVQVQRQISGRWSLGTGLGYQVFATTQPVLVRVAYSSITANYSPPDSVGTLAVRDTYRFLTLPLRVGYQLGTGHGPLRYGLRAGAEVAFYLGGHSIEGSTPGGTGRSWGASGSPYRPLSLALSLGAEVRYQLAPGWELLAQPTLTHFATSVARPSTGYVVRYPLGASVLVGVSYWLR